MTTNPADLLEVRAVVAQLTGDTPNELGIMGDPAHAGRGGYHEGKDALAAAGRLDRDYSVVESAHDRAGLTDDASAFDLGGDWPHGGDTAFRRFNGLYVNACQAGIAGTEVVREVIYSLDGRDVHRWDRLRRRSDGPDSHRFHTHTSFFRDTAGRRGGAYLELLKRLIDQAIHDAGGTAPVIIHVAGQTHPTVQRGSTGEWVKRAQGLLLADGVSVGHAGIDGVFGHDTDAATRAFQGRQRIAVDGIIGPVTWGRLIGAMRNVKRGSTGPDVRKSQGLLLANGVSVGHAGIDGVFGHDTDAGTRAFQHHAHITVDGIIGPVTRARLGA